MIVLYQLLSAGHKDVPREHLAMSGNIFGHSQGGVTGIQWVEVCPTMHSKLPSPRLNGVNGALRNRGLHITISSAVVNSEIAGGFCCFSLDLLSHVPHEAAWGADGWSQMTVILQREGTVCLSQLQSKHSRRFLHLFFYCYRTNYHIVSSLKITLFISSQFCKSEVRAQCDWVLCSGFLPEPGCIPFSGKESTFKFIQMVGTVQSLLVIGPRPCFLAGRQLEATCIPCHVAPSTSKASNGESFTCQIPLAMKLSAFPDSVWSQNRSNLPGQSSCLKVKWCEAFITSAKSLPSST